MRMYYRIIRIVLTICTTFWNRIAMLMHGVQYGKGFRSCGNILFRRYGGRICFGDNVSINSHQISDPIGGDSKTIMVATASGSIRIGNRVGISNTAFFSSCSIVVEDDVCIGAGCKVYDTDFHSIYPSKRLNGNTDVKSAPVVIKNKSFIGGHSIILKGVTIGEGAVIAAGSVVTRNIPAYEIWGGNPVNFIKKVDM